MPVLYQDMYSKLVDEAIIELRAKTDITQLTPGAKARAILEIVSREVGTAYSTFSADFLQAYVKHATGTNLDLIGELLGVRRTRQTRNQVTALDKIQKFYVETGGTFGSINGGSNIVIPRGTEIRTRMIGSNDTPVRYTVTQNTVLVSTDTVAYVPVRAIEYGTFPNVGAGSLVVHNFENYSDYLNNTLKTTNIEGIAYAQNAETDTDYRYRIVNQTLAGQTGNRTAIRLAAFGVPGVADVFIDRYAYGIGSSKVYIQGIVPVIGESLVAAVQMAIDEVAPEGSYIVAAAPNLVGVELVISLNLLDKVNATQESDLLRRTRDVIYQYINNLEISGSLDAGLLERQILAVDPNIKSIGTTSKRIDNMWVWKFSSANDSRIRYESLSGYLARDFERIVVEYSAMPDNRDPIRIRVNQ